MDDNNKSLINEGEIDLLQLITELWNKKALIIFLTTIAAIISVLYSLSLPNIYRSQALLAPADSQSQGMSSSLGGLSSIAGIAGISIPGTGDAKKTEAIAILNSHQFLEEFINSHNLVVPIMASKGWDKESNKLIFNEKLYDAQKNQWLVEDGKDLKPSIQETVKKFRLMVSSSVDKKNGYLLIFADTYSPYISKQWVELLIVDINKYIMEADVERAEKSLEYLNSQINQTAIPELKQVVAQLIKKNNKL